MFYKRAQEEQCPHLTIRICRKRVFGEPIVLDATTFGCLVFTRNDARGLQDNLLVNDTVRPELFRKYGDELSRSICIQTMPRIKDRQLLMRHIQNTCNVMGRPIATDITQREEVMHTLAPFPFQVVRKSFVVFRHFIGSFPFYRRKGRYRCEPFDATSHDPTSCIPLVE